MGDKNKNKKEKKGQKEKPAFYNDQLGENAGEGRMMKTKDEKHRK